MSDYALQNIPLRTEGGKKLREAFSGKSILEVDYSTIELSLLEVLEGKEKDGKVCDNS